MYSKIKNWKFDSEEENYFHSISTNQNNSCKERISIIQICQDLKISHHFNKLMNNSPSEYFVCIAPNITYYNFWAWITLFPRFLKDFHHFMIKKKWKKIYKKFGVEIYYSSDKISFSKKIKNILLAFEFYKTLSSRKKLLEHKFNGIKCGDLIYDSYLRFAKKPTLKIKDPTLLLFIYDCYNQIEYFQDLVKQKKIDKYYSSYSTYISHGVPVRVFLNKGIEVYTIGYSTFDDFKIKELNKEDLTQVSPHWNYKNIFKSFKDKNKLIELGLKKIEDRLNGLDKLDYMDSNQYDQNYNVSLESKFDGIVFLGDFTDAQHIYRSLVYDDLYLWFKDTAKIIKRYKLNVGFKPHPNNKPESKLIIRNLKKMYPEISWIDPMVSNKSIFSSGIKFGISAYGTILSELAFNNIIPICCGDNPCSMYDFIFEAKSKIEYEKLIKNHKNLKLSKNYKKELGEFIYLDKIYFSKMR